jgi:hypothetical protein
MPVRLGVQLGAVRRRSPRLRGFGFSQLKLSVQQWCWVVRGTMVLAATDWYL